MSLASHMTDGSLFGIAVLSDYLADIPISMKEGSLMLLPPVLDIQAMATRFTPYIS